jgi:RND family efflux transporter MFP subunit
VHARATRITLLFALALGSGLSGCSPKTTSAATESIAGGVKEREIPPIRVAVIQSHEMVQVLETTSKLESEGEVELFPRLPGEAVEVLTEEGDQVTHGQVLARLDDRDEELSVKDAEVALQEAKDRQVLSLLAIEDAEAQITKTAWAAAQAERDYQRDVELFEATDVASPLSKQALEAKLLERDNAMHEKAQCELTKRRSTLEEQQAQTAIARAEVALDIAEHNLDKKKIIAPFDGIIALRNIRVGDSVGTGEAAYILTDTGTLRAVFSRPQEEFGLFTQGGAQGASPDSRTNGSSHLSLTATAEAYPGQVFEGWVERISPTIDPDSGQFRVTARLVAPEEAGGVQLLPGMLVRMEIITDRHADALTVPKRALRREGERRFVLRIEDQGGGDHVVRRVNVLEGFEDDENVEITPVEPQALAEGDRIVFVGSRDLVDGDSVRVDKGGADEPGMDGIDGDEGEALTETDDELASTAAETD